MGRRLAWSPPGEYSSLIYKARAASSLPLSSPCPDDRTEARASSVASTGIIRFTPSSYSFMVHPRSATICSCSLSAILCSRRKRSNMRFSFLVTSATFTMRGGFDGGDGDGDDLLVDNGDDDDSLFLVVVVVVEVVVIVCTDCK